MMNSRNRVLTMGAALAGLTLACVAPFHLRVPWLIMINVAATKLFLLPIAVLDRLGAPIDSFTDWAFTFGAHIRGGIWFMNEEAVYLVFGTPALLLVVSALVAARVQRKRRVGAA